MSYNGEWTEERRNKVKESNSNRELSEETLQKMSESAKARPPRELPEGMKTRIEHVFVGGIESKMCSKCKVVKALTEFGKEKSAKNGTGIAYYCKLCRRQTKNEHYAKSPEYRKQQSLAVVKRLRTIKVQCVEYLGNKCNICELQHIPYKNSTLFDFHHKDPQTKDFTITEARSKVFENIKEELNKCLLLCSNCHRQLHADLWLKEGRVLRKKEAPVESTTEAPIKY